MTNDWHFLFSDILVYCKRNSPQFYTFKVQGCVGMVVHHSCTDFSSRWVPLRHTHTHTHTRSPHTTPHHTTPHHTTHHTPDRTHACIHAYIHSNLHTYTQHTHTTHTHTHTHTHTPAQGLIELNKCWLRSLADNDKLGLKNLVQLVAPHKTDVYCFVSFLASFIDS